MAHWSVLLPYFNEAEYLQHTLESLAAQTVRPLRLILVDNASTDGSEAIARQTLARFPDVEAVFLSEPRPGKTPALTTGLAAVDTPLVATCDADTWYPPEYLARCERLFDSGGPRCVAVLACHIYDEPDAESARAQRYRIVRKAQRRPRICHAGGYAQAFRTAVLRAAGGYDERIWPFVLLDHEVIHRMLKRGHTRYDFEHWCRASPRRTDRSRVRWTRGERWLYRHTPFWLKDWFFYRFLAPRFAARGMWSSALRQHSWTDGRVVVERMAA